MLHRTASARPLAGLGRAHRLPLGGAAALILVEAALELARPWPVQLVVDHVVGDRPTTGWPGPLAGASDTVLAAAAAAALVLLTVVSGLVSATATVLVGRSAERIGLDTRRRLVRALLSRPTSFFARHRVAELVTRVTTDVDRVDDAVVAWWEVAVPELVVLAGTFVVLALIDVWLAVVAMAVSPALVLLMVRRRRAIRRVHDVAREAEGRLGHQTADLLRNVRVVQAFGAEQLAGRTFDEASRRAAGANERAVEVEARSTPLVDVVLATGMAAVLLVGSLRAADGEMTAGMLVVALSYVGGLHVPLRSLSSLASMLARAEASRRRLQEVFEPEAGDVEGSVRAAQPVPPARAAEAWSVGAGAALEGVVFSRGTRRVLDGVDLCFPGGRVTALVGPTGIGKSTVLDLLLCLERPEAGRVVVDGRDVAGLDPTEVRRRIAYVPQESWFLDDTVRANIAVGRPGASAGEVEAAARSAHVVPFALRLPHGLDTRIGESGLLLSGGERKRLSVARAVLRDASLLLLDEPTAGLDDDATREVLAAVGRSSAGRTVVVVTHDPRVVRWADCVLHLPVRGLRAVDDATSQEPVGLLARRAGGR